MKPEEPHQLKINFLSFIAALEDEFAKKQKSRKMEATDKAILLRVEKNPLAGCPDITCGTGPTGAHLRRRGF